MWLKHQWTKALWLLLAACILPVQEEKLPLDYTNNIDMEIYISFLVQNGHLLNGSWHDYFNQSLI